MIIALTGKKGSGKDTVADLIQQHTKGLGQEYHKYSFAGAIKEALNLIFGWDESKWTPEFKESTDPAWGISPRQAAQHLGTDWAQESLCGSFPEFARVTGRLLWVNRLLQQIREDGKSAIITDMRFIHEYEAVRQLENSLVVRVVRKGIDCSDTHRSETEMEGITEDMIIHNNGTKEDLSNTILKNIDYFSV